MHVIGICVPANVPYYCYGHGFWHSQCAGGSYTVVSVADPNEERNLDVVPREDGARNSY